MTTPTALLLLHASFAAAFSVCGGGGALEDRGVGAVRGASAAPRCNTPLMMGRKGRPKGPMAGMPPPNAMQQQQRQPDAPSDGTPLFYLYCRSGEGKPWYPISAMKGDGQSKGLISAWLNAPMAKGVFRDRLDQGMAKTIFDSERRLAGLATEQYAQLRPFKARLQW